MFTLPAVVASIALKDATNAFEACWEAGAACGDVPPHRLPRARLAGLLTLVAAYLSR